jgi:hypothetical protein
LEHLMAFSIVFVAGFLSAASFITYMERVRRNAVRDHYKRVNAESSLAAARFAPRSVEG